MNKFHTISAIFSPPVGWDWDEAYVNQLKRSKEGEERRKARKQRARELTRLCEIEIREKKGVAK